ncbi:hypothetical protein ACMDCR_02730 [Labrys okinawensis]|uniref:hypothetical protein n=1 Tax=Labrys okinawensis TaxID=346911 RepID=UPI0039BD2737
MPTINAQSLLLAFDRIGEAATKHGTRLELLVYGGSALMIASNFRFATEDVDIASIGEEWPDRLLSETRSIARENEWSEDWLNDAVQFHLSSSARKDTDHILFGSYPPDSEKPGLAIYIPKPEYMLALKLKAMRFNDPAKGETETNDVVQLMRTIGISTANSAIDVLRQYFPKSAEALKSRNSC